MAEKDTMIPEDRASGTDAPPPPPYNTSLNPAPRMTDHANNIYDSRDVPDADARYPYLAAALRERVEGVAVEFLERGGARPHVCLILRLAHPALGTTLVRLSVEPVWTRDGDGDARQTPAPAPGSAACVISLFGAYARTLGSNARYIFRMWNTQQPLSAFVKVVTGEHLGVRRLYLTGDMTAFRLALRDLGAGRKVYSGTRDWVSQVFYRFYAMHWVDWQVSMVLPPCHPASEVLSEDWQTPIHRPRQGSKPINWEEAYFHNIIGIYPEQPVVVAPQGDDDHDDDGQFQTSAYYHDLPLARGQFLDPEFTRVVEHRIGEMVAAFPYEEISISPMSIQAILGGPSRSDDKTRENWNRA